MNKHQAITSHHADLTDWGVVLIVFRKIKKKSVTNLKQTMFVRNWEITKPLIPLLLILSFSYTLSRDYWVVRNRYSRLLFTSEDRLCANLRVQEQSTDMTSQCQHPAFAWRNRSTVDKNMLFEIQNIFHTSPCAQKSHFPDFCTNNEECGWRTWYFGQKPVGIGLLSWLHVCNAYIRKMESSMPSYVT